MLYFFHNYELPAIEQQINGRRDNDAYLDEAVQMIVEGIEMVAGQQQQREGQNNGRDNDAPPANNAAGENTVQQGGENGGGDQPATQFQEIPTNDQRNRVFVFAGEGPVIQLVRDFVRSIQERLNATANTPAIPPAAVETPASAIIENNETTGQDTMTAGTETSLNTSNELVSNTTEISNEHTYHQVATESTLETMGAQSAPNISTRNNEILEQTFNQSSAFSNQQNNRIDGALHLEQLRDDTSPTRPNISSSNSTDENIGNYVLANLSYVVLDHEID